MDAKQIIHLLEAPTQDRRPIFRKVKAEASIAALTDALRIATTPLTRELLADILGYREEDEYTILEMKKVLRSLSTSYE